jgi:hypothetical protein
MKQNLPRGRVLQGEPELGMLSLSLLMQNEEHTTPSSRPNIYKNSTSF